MADLDVPPHPVIRRAVEIALRIGVVLVDRRRDVAGVERQQRDGELERAGAAEQMPGHRLGRAEDQRAGLLAEHRLDRLGLGDVALLAWRCRGR